LNRYLLKLVKQVPLGTKTISSALRVVILMLIVTEVAYPLVLIAVGQNILPFQSNGGIVTFNGKSVGSELISQKFKSPKFLRPRPSSDSMSEVWIQILPLKVHFRKFQL
jgi:potassium-transporting ATPase KdpC subunit